MGLADLVPRWRGCQARAAIRAFFFQLTHHTAHVQLGHSRVGHAGLPGCPVSGDASGKRSQVGDGKAAFYSVAAPDPIRHARSWLLWNRRGHAGRAAGHSQAVEWIVFFLPSQERLAAGQPSGKRPPSNMQTLPRTNQGRKSAELPLVLTDSDVLPCSGGCVAGLAGSARFGSACAWAWAALGDPSRGLVSTIFEGTLLRVRRWRAFGTRHSTPKG
jgi:hypothetical protein